MGHKFFTMQKNYNEKSREKINRQISIIQGVMNQRSQREERRVVEEDASVDIHLLHLLHLSCEQIKP